MCHQPEDGGGGSSFWGYLGSEGVLSRDLPYRGAGCCLSSRAFSAPGLLSVTSLLRNSRRQEEMGASVPGPCRSARLRKWGGSGLQLPCLWLGRPQIVSDGASAEQPPSPRRLESACTPQQPPGLRHQPPARAWLVWECGMPEGAWDSPVGSCKSLVLVNTPKIHIP